MDVNHLDEDGNSALVYALSKDLNMARLLLSNGADREFPDENGETLLISAIKYNSGIEKVKLLLEYPVNINAEDVSGMTALSYASELGKIEIVEMLLEKGADPNIEDIEGYTPLTNAMFGKYPFIFKLLIEYGASLDSYDDLSPYLNQIEEATEKDNLNITFTIPGEGVKHTTQLTPDLKVTYPDEVIYYIKKGHSLGMSFHSLQHAYRIMTDPVVKLQIDSVNGNPVIKSWVVEAH